MVINEPMDAFVEGQMYIHQLFAEWGIPMKYTMYYEECNTVTTEKYESMKQNIQRVKNKNNFENYTLRKLQFTGLSSQGVQPNYFLCIKNSDDTKIYLEKKYMQDGIYYKKCTALSKEECEKILKGDIQWLKNHKKELLADFYRHATLNYLRPGHLTDYNRETINCKKEGYITFCKKINRAVGTGKGLFDKPDMTISCLGDHEVLVTCKKIITLPVMISNMLQNQEEQTEDLAFVL